MVLAGTDNGLTQPLFRPPSPFRLLDFQADFAAQCYFNSATILAADVGLGKSVITMATACALIEDGLIDLVVIACESAKLGEWESDILTFTGLRPRLYVGPPTAKPLKKPRPGPPRSRQEVRERLDEVDVLIGVYETLRNDLGAWEDAPDLGRGFKPGWKKGDVPQRMGAGPLVHALKHRRVLYVMDEGPAKLGASRTSGLYQANERFINDIRLDGELRVICVSATPMDRDPEGFFNLCRLFQPMPNVTTFNRDYVASWDLYQRPASFKNLHPDYTEPGKTSLRELVGNILLVKSKNDPDVVGLFPKTVQDYTYVRLSDKEQAFYEWLISEYSGDEGEEGEGGVYMALRQACGHPLALLRSRSGVGADIAARVGEKKLAMLGASKAEALLGRLDMICKSQGEQAVVFTYFGQSVLPVLAQEMRDRGFTVTVNHGQMDPAQKTIAQQTFRSGQTQIFLSSDAGCRGINLPEAAYVEEYDFPLKHSIHKQRIARVSRLSSKNPVIFSNAWACKGTLEEGIISTMLRRRGWSGDLVIKDQITNEMIRKMLKERRKVAA